MFGVLFDMSKFLKARVFTNFLAQNTSTTSKLCTMWIFFTNKASNRGGSNAELIFVREAWLIIEVSIRFKHY